MAKGSKVVPNRDPLQREECPEGYESGERKTSGAASMFPDPGLASSKNRTNSKDPGHGKPSL